MQSRAHAQCPQARQIRVSPCSSATATAKACVHVVVRALARCPDRRVLPHAGAFATGALTVRPWGRYSRPSWNSSNATPSWTGICMFAARDAANACACACAHARLCACVVCVRARARANDVERNARVSLKPFPSTVVCVYTVPQPLTLGQSLNPDP